MATFDLVRTARETLTTMLISTRLRASHAVLLVDHVTLRVLSHGMRMSELLNEMPHVTLIELVDSARATRAPIGMAQLMDVVYFLEPTAGSVQAALADYMPNVPCAYGGSAHFLFSRHLPDSLLALIRNSPVIERIATVRELNLQFLPLCRTAFSLDAPQALATLYGPSSTTHRDAVLDVLAEQVVGMYTSSKLPLPRVRYAASHPVCKQFAQLLAVRFGALATATPTTLSTESAASAADAAKASCCRRYYEDRTAAANARRGTLLLLERALDPITPLVVDFSLEALAESLGVLHGGRFFSRSETSGGDRGGSEGCGGVSEQGGGDSELGGATVAARDAHEVLLLDSDPVWADLRHRPFEEAGEEVRRHLLRFQADHAHIDRAQRQGESMSNAQRQDAMRSQLDVSYRKRKEQIRQQEELIREVQLKLLSADSQSKTALYEQLSFEQDLATGRKADATVLSHREVVSRTARILTALAEEDVARQPPVSFSPTNADAPPSGVGPTFDSPPQPRGTGRTVLAMPKGAEGPAAAFAQDRSEGERCRLLALLTACRRLTDAEIAQMVRASKLSPTVHHQVQRALAQLGLPLRLPSEPNSPGGAGTASNLRLAPASGSDREVELRRHSPLIASLMLHGLRGTLSTSGFPFIDGGHEEADAADPLETAPASSHVGSWAFRRRCRADSEEATVNRLSEPPLPPRLVVFMLGGASHAELRCAHEAGEKVGFGCTALLTPLQYVRSLRQIGQCDAFMSGTSDVGSLLDFG